MNEQNPWPITGRVPASSSKGIREREVLRIAVNVMGKDRPKAIVDARNEVLKWAQNRVGRQLPADAWAFQDFEFLPGGGNSIGVRINEGGDIWALRVDNPDGRVAGRTWSTETTVWLSEKQPPRLSARLLVSASSEDGLNIEPHVPGFIQQIEEKCGISCELGDLGSSPWLIDSISEADRFFETLVDQNRKLPVFVLSVPDNAKNQYIPLLDAVALVRATMGISYVVILPPLLARTMSDKFGEQRSVFNGGVRSYLSGFALDANPEDHRHFLAGDIADEGGAAKCMAWMRSTAATESIRHTSLGKDVLAFADIRNISLELKRQKLELDGASISEQLALEKERRSALETQLEGGKAMLEYFTDEHAKAEERAKAAEDRARVSAFHVQQLLDELRVKGHDVDRAIAPPASWETFAGWCDANLTGRVVLTPRARRFVRAPDFKDHEQAARCLMWLAKDYRDRRLAGGEGSLRDAVVEEGIHNTPCGGDSFEIEWEGVRRTVDWHLKNGGNVREPRRCLRIYYFWDPSAQVVVVAELPAHRRTDAT